MKHLCLAALMAVTALPVCAQSILTDADLRRAYSTRSYNQRISVHDPSIVMDNITNPSSPVYYIYGSHLGHGSTTAKDDYRAWNTSWRAGEVDGTTASLFADADGKLINYADAYGDAHSWQSKGYTVKGNQWAPDIIYNKQMKKWCLYMSLNGDHWCSSIILFTSNSPRGPWQNQGIVTYSGFQGTYAHNGYSATSDWTHTDLQKVLGTTTTTLPSRYNVGGNWGTYWPNDIDPCVFYDDDDNLWMSYGSWSGGIFLLKLDSSTGLRDYTYTYPYEINGNKVAEGYANANCTSDPYFGKKIAGGYYNSGEGSYIQKIGNYYFLFMSYGGLNPSQGYQMRVFRSEKFDGPYVDCNGTSAIYRSGVRNYGSNARDNRGVLLMEGYQWDTMPTGEVAQGHNSAFIDEKGRAFVVYHTKFNDGTFGHQVRVHQLFLNEDGWLVAAPYEFNGETVTNDDVATKASVADSDIPGDYQFIRHQYDQSHAAVASDNQATTAKLTTPVNITLTADGKVTGSGIRNGSWTRKAGTDFITLSLSGVNYKGVLVNQTIDYTNIKALCIAALSDDSGSNGLSAASQTRQQEVWASKAATKGAVKYTLDKTTSPVRNGQTITADITLPVKGYLGTTVSWKSSDDQILDAATGKIKGSGPVTLTLTISKDSSVYTRQYSITVDNGEEKENVYYPTSEKKDTTLGWWANFSTQYYTVKKGEKAEFKFYNYSNEALNWNNWCLVATNGERNATGYAEYFVLRNDNYGWGTDYNAANLTSNYNWNTFRSDMNGSLVDMTVSYDNNSQLEMSSTITTKSGKVYNYGYKTAITGTPSQVTLFFVNEKSYIDGSGLATGISAITNTHKRVADNRVYNLNGQLVDSSYHGVVIKNGKKYIQR